MMAKHHRPFDIFTTYAGHSGFDYPYPSWEPILATGTGTVSTRSSNSAGGNFCYVNYDDGQREGNFHLWDQSGPGSGTRVVEGNTICYVGSTGNSTGPHLHHEVYNPHGSLRSGDAYWNYVDKSAGGYVNGGPVVLAPNQRQVGPIEVLRRGDPSTQNPPIEPELEPGTIGNFDGWIYGENVSGNNVWFRGISGNWFWSGGFTDTGTHDLADLNPPPTTATQRAVLASAPANVRPDPSTTHSPVGSLAPSSVHNMSGWAHGELTGGIDIWYRLADGTGWAWAGGFTSQSTDGLDEVNTDPTPPPYSFEAFSPVVTEVMPCALGNYESGAGGTRFPEDQTDVVLHDYGTLGTDTYEGTVAWFQNPASGISAHLVISWAHITQMVAITDRAYHAGPDGNWYIGIEVDPIVGYTGSDPVMIERRDQTIANVNLALDALRAHFGVAVFVYHRHSEFMQTTCGDDIDFADYPQGDECPECPECPDPSDPVDYARIAKDVNDEAARRREGWT